MSRIGKKPLPISPEISVTLEQSKVIIQGPKGELALTLHPLASVKLVDGQIIVDRKGDSKLAKSIHGLTRALLANMVCGVKFGYEKRLELVGTGYRVAKKGQDLQLSLGFSHLIDFQSLPEISFELEGNTGIIVRGIDKHLVGQVAASIRALRPPEPYKGKGIRYVGEYVRRKAGKQAKAGAAVGGGGAK